MHLVQSLVQTYAEQERAAHRERWKRLTQIDPAKVRAFVKGRADVALMWEAEPEPAEAIPGGWHPAAAVEEQAQIWVDKWSQPFEPDFGKIDTILEVVPRPAPCASTFGVTAEALRASMHAMRHKVGGPDDWRPSQLLRLPDLWWKSAADLWNSILWLGRVPRQWKQARVALIWKSKKKSRPITLLCALWRAGARLIKEQLLTWTDSWQQFYDSGGLPSTSVHGALMQIKRAFSKGASHFAQLDVSAYFDSVHFGALKRVLQHLRFPPVILNLLQDSYSGAQRIFCLSSAHCKDWHEVTLGIPQGCPLSPLLAACLGHIWGTWVRSSSCVETLSYVDDRTIWILEHQPLNALASAIASSAQFDAAFNFRLSLEKCSIVSRRQGADTEALAKRFDFKTASSLEILGVRASFEGEWRLLRFHVQKALLRVKLLKWATQSQRIHQQVVSALITPCFAWAAGFARPDISDLADLRNGVYQLFDRQVKANSARVLAFEAIGWMLEPTFACDFSALRVLWKVCTAFPRWMETLPLTEARFSWKEAVPEATFVLQRYGWSLCEDGQVLTRLDRQGRMRALHLGYDGLDVAFRWMRQHYRQTFALSAGRVARSLHRDDPDLATGLCLPQPSGHEVYHFDGHRQSRAVQSREATLASTGAGGTVWHFNANGHFSEDHPRWRCMCRLLHPVPTLFGFAPAPGHSGKASAHQLTEARNVFWLPDALSSRLRRPASIPVTSMTL